MGSLTGSYRYTTLMDSTVSHEHFPRSKDYTKPLKAVRIFDHTENEVRIFTHNNRVEPLARWRSLTRYVDATDKQ